MLKRGERGGHRARVAWKMQHARHLRARVAIRASERHGEGAFNGKWRNAKVLVACGELTLKIGREFVGCLCRQIEVCCGVRHPRSEEHTSELQSLAYL